MLDVPRHGRIPWYTSSSSWICPSLVYYSRALLAYFTWRGQSLFYSSARPPASTFVRYNSRTNSNVFIGDRTQAMSLEDGSNIQFSFPQRLPFKPYRIPWLLTLGSSFSLCILSLACSLPCPLWSWLAKPVPLSSPRKQNWSIKPFSELHWYKQTKLFLLILMNSYHAASVSACPCPLPSRARIRSNKKVGDSRLHPAAEENKQWINFILMRKKAVKLILERFRGHRIGINRDG